MPSKSLTVIVGILMTAAVFNILRNFGPRWSRSIFARKHGCQSAVHFPHREPFLGLDFFFDLIKCTKGKRRMERTKKLFDSENIQSVMAQDFDG